MNNYSIKIYKDNSLIDYMPTFLSSDSLWLLVVNRSDFQNSLYDKGKLFLFAVPILFLALLIFLAIYLVFRPMLLMSDMVGREGSSDAGKLYVLTSEVMSRGKQMCFFEMYRVLSVFEKMANELSSYQKDAQYKLSQFEKVVAQVYFDTLRYEKQQRKMAIYDTLTGLPNGFLLEDRITTVIKYNASEKRRTCLILINIVGLKDVGEEYSHIVSDSMLKTFAVRLNEKVDDRGTLYRYDYCQFAVLLTNLKRDYDIQASVKRLFSVINNPGSYVDAPLSEAIALDVSCRIGVSLADSPSFTAKKLIEAASENAELCVTDEHDVLSNIFNVKGSLDDGAL
jgi:diguanylate cyclase (GGDEF)-like protein